MKFCTQSTFFFIWCCIFSTHPAAGTLDWLKGLFNFGGQGSGGYGHGYGNNYGGGYTGGGGGIGSSLLSRHPWLYKIGNDLFDIGNLGSRRPVASGSGWFGGAGHSSGGYIGGYGNTVGGYFPHRRPRFGGHFDQIRFPRND